MRRSGNLLEHETDLTMLLRNYISESWTILKVTELGSIRMYSKSSESQEIKTMDQYNKASKNMTRVGIKRGVTGHQTFRV